MRTSLRRTFTKTALAVTTIALAGSGALVAPAGASAASHTSADYLAAQIPDGVVVSEYNDGTNWVGYRDWGLTLDFYYAFGQLDTKAGKRAQILDVLDTKFKRYTDAFGTRYAGALGKLLTAVETAGRDPETYGRGDRNLLADLEALVVTTGPETGRAKDDTDFSDTSNTFGQAYVATALAGGGSDRAADAVTFLLKQQCSDGFFRENMASSDFTCDAGTGDESTPSVDATATAALAAFALAVDGPLSTRADAAAAFQDAVAWLISQQRDSGAFVGNGVANSNSTGLAASALIAAGKNGKAKKAAQWIDDLRVTSRLARTTSYKSADVGAVAYSKASFKTGKNKGITRGAKYEWRRSTAQAAPALALIG